MDRSFTKRSSLKNSHGERESKPSDGECVVRRESSSLRWRPRRSGYRLSAMADIPSLVLTNRFDAGDTSIAWLLPMDVGSIELSHIEALDDMWF